MCLNNNFIRGVFMIIIKLLVSFYSCIIESCNMINLYEECKFYFCYSDVTFMICGCYILVDV